MARMFFNRIGIVLFYICIIVYLYGDLAIYVAAVPKNIVSILCNNLTCRANMSLPTSNLSAICRYLDRQNFIFCFLPEIYFLAIILMYFLTKIVTFHI